ncbi:hypothetical protein DSECCO2_656560 [anaerobic digester metagenome]
MNTELFEFSICAAQDIKGLSVKYNLPFIHYKHAVSQFENFIELVLYENQGYPFFSVQSPEQVKYFPGTGGVQVRRRLVKDKDFRLHCQVSSYCSSLFFPA